MAFTNRADALAAARRIKRLREKMEEKTQARKLAKQQEVSALVDKIADIRLKKKPLLHGGHPAGGVSKITEIDNDAIRLVFAVGKLDARALGIESTAKRHRAYMSHYLYITARSDSHEEKSTLSLLNDLEFVHITSARWLIPVADVILILEAHGLAKYVAGHKAIAFLKTPYHRMTRPAAAAVLKMLKLNLAK